MLNISGFLEQITLVRIIDIALVWWLVYRLLMLIRGTKAVTLLRGVAFVIIIKLVGMLVLRPFHG